MECQLSGSEPLLMIRLNYFHSGRENLYSVEVCRHEKGIEYVQGKLESFSGSGGNFVPATYFSGTTPFVRGSFDRCAVEFFLFLVDRSTIGSRRKFSGSASQKDYANRLAHAPRNDFRGIGGRRAHFHGTFLDVGNFVRRVLFDCTLYLGSLRSQKKIRDAGLEANQFS